jgi:sorting nexin-8
MFNAPRPAQRYAGASSTAGFGGSYVDENPLSSSVYDDGLDPWSSAPSPTPAPMPQGPSSVFNSVIGMQTTHSLEVLANWNNTADATVPAIYHTSFAAIDPKNTGETSVNSLSRVLTTSSLPAATVDKVRPGG